MPAITMIAEVTYERIKAGWTFIWANMIQYVHTHFEGVENLQVMGLVYLFSG